MAHIEGYAHICPQCMGTYAHNKWARQWTVSIGIGFTKWFIGIRVPKIRATTVGASRIRVYVVV